MGKCKIVISMLEDYYADYRKFTGKRPLRTIWHRSIEEEDTYEFVIFFNDHKYSVTIKEEEVQSAYHTTQCAISKFDYMIKATTPKGAY